MLPEYNVQSVCLSNDRVIIGMRSGSIYEVKVAEGKAKTEQVKHWIKATDHEVLKSVVTDMVSSRVFSITQYGLF
jgi:TusA-related sulfurtransferase